MRVYKLLVSILIVEARQQRNHQKPRCKLSTSSETNAVYVSNLHPVSHHTDTWTPRSRTHVTAVLIPFPSKTSRAKYPLSQKRDQ